MVSLKTAFGGEWLAGAMNNEPVLVIDDTNRKPAKAWTPLHDVIPALTPSSFESVGNTRRKYLLFVSCPAKFQDCSAHQLAHAGALGICGQ